MMTGWKTWVAAALAGLIAANSVLQILPPEAVTGLVALAAAFGVVGIGHKIEKAGNGNGSA